MRSNGGRQRAKRSHEVPEAKELVKLFNRLVSTIECFGLDFDDNKRDIIKERVIAEMLYHLKVRAMDIREKLIIFKGILQVEQGLFEIIKVE